MAEEEKNEGVVCAVKRIIFSDSSVSHSAEDKDEEKFNKSSPKDTEEKCESEPLNNIEEKCESELLRDIEEKCESELLKDIEETSESELLNDIEEQSESEPTSPKEIVASGSSSFRLGILDYVAQIDPKSYPQQWCGFLRKLRKGPSASMYTFNPGLPSLPSIKKLTSRKKTRKRTQSMPEICSTFDARLCCFEASWTIYSLSQLKHATDNFNHENLIGEGGYSEVYKGHLKDGRIIAVKRLIRGTPEEMTSDFLSELGILVHVNLIFQM